MNNYRVTYTDNDFTNLSEEIQASGYYIDSGKRDRVTFYIEEKGLRSVEGEGPSPYAHHIPSAGVYTPMVKQYYAEPYRTRKEIATFFDPISIKFVTTEYDPKQQPHSEGDI